MILANPVGNLSYMGIYGNFESCGNFKAKGNAVNGTRHLCAIHRIAHWKSPLFRFFSRPDVVVFALCGFGGARAGQELLASWGHGSDSTCVDQWVCV